MPVTKEDRKKAAQAALDKPAPAETSPSTAFSMLPEPPGEPITVNAGPAQDGIKSAVQKHLPSFLKPSWAKGEGLRRIYTEDDLRDDVRNMHRLLGRPVGWRDLSPEMRVRLGKAEFAVQDLSKEGTLGKDVYRVHLFPYHEGDRASY